MLLSVDRPQLVNSELNLRLTLLVIAYLMKYKHMTLKDAFDMVASIRSGVCPNRGFFNQLAEFEKELYRTSTLELINLKSLNKKNS